MRHGVITFLIALRGLGPAPLALYFVFLAVAGIQEPLFFRMQGMGLVWPACATMADLLTLAAIGSWILGVRHVFGMAHPWKSGLGLFAFALFVVLAGALLCSSLDFTRRLPMEPVLIWNLVARAACVWGPISLLATPLANCCGGTPGVLVLLLGAFLVQITVHPVSMAGQGPAFANFLLTLLAFAGSAAAASRDRLASPARAH